MTLKEVPDKVLADMVRNGFYKNPTYEELLGALKEMLSAQICGESCALCEKVSRLIARAAEEVTHD